MRVIKMIFTSQQGVKLKSKLQQQKNLYSWQKNIAESSYKEKSRKRMPEAAAF